MNAGMRRHLAIASASPRQTPDPVYTVRRASRADRGGISSLEWEHKWVLDIYGFKKVLDQLEHASLCVIVEDADGDFQGYAVFNNYPDEAIVRRDSWKAWMLKQSPLSEPATFKAVTCLFFTQLICARESCNHVLKSIFTWIFSEMPDLEFVFHVVKCEYKLLQFLEDIGFMLISQFGSPIPVLQVERLKFVPRLSTRLARLEDHDDLRGMFSLDEDRLKERYGDYFLAEFIADKRESSLSVVLEVQKLAVGIMSVTTEIDYQLLNENFELTPFHGLRKPAKGDRTGMASKLCREVLGIRPSSLRDADEEAEEAEDQASSAADADCADTAGAADGSGDTADGEVGTDDKVEDRKSSVKFSPELEGGEPDKSGEANSKGSEASIKGGEAESKGGEADSKGGEVASKGGEADSKGGEAVSKGGEADNKGGEVASKGGEADSKGDEAVSKGGEADSKGGEADNKGGEVASKGGEADSKGGEVASKGGEADSKGDEAVSKGGEADSKGGEADNKGGEIASKGGEADSKGDEAVSKGGEADSKGGNADSKSGEADNKGGDADSKGSEADSKGNEADSKGSEVDSKGGGVGSKGDGAKEANKEDTSEQDNKSDVGKAKADDGSPKHGTDSKADVSKPDDKPDAAKDGAKAGPSKSEMPQPGIKADLPDVEKKPDAPKADSANPDLETTDKASPPSINSKASIGVNPSKSVAGTGSKADAAPVDGDAGVTSSSADATADVKSSSADATAVKSSSADTAADVKSSSADATGEPPSDQVDSDPTQPTVCSAAQHLAVLEQLWGPGALEAGAREDDEEQAPIPDDEVPDGSRPVLEMIWGYPVSEDGRVTRQVSGTVSGLSTEPATGPPPVARAVPRYRGHPNAAAVTLFCVREEHASRSLDLLPAVFSRLPDLDYLLMTVFAEEEESALTRLFTRVPHRSSSTFPGQLYVFHRASLITSLSVEPAESRDLGDIRSLVKYTEKAEQVMLSVRELFLDNAAQSSVFVVRCCEQLVGVLVVKSEDNMDYMRSHFEIEEYVRFDLHAREGFGHLYHFLLNPIFLRFAHIVLAEVMRLTPLSVLLYPLFPPGSEDVVGHSLTAAVDRFWPVTWRRQIQYPIQHYTLGVNVPLPVILQVQDPCALQLVTRGSVLCRRRRINSRIVVVGGGDAGLAVLETLVFSRELLFTNLTLVETHGFQGEGEAAEEATGMRISSENFQQRRLATMWLHAWVNLVRGVMTSIDRKRQCIRVGVSGEEVPYDHLLLCCGLQYQLPPRLVPRPPRPFTDRPPLFPPVQLPEAPDNVFRINSVFDASRALEYVRAYCLDRTENVIVYGRYLETLTCLETLIELPVPVHRLVLVLPPGRHGDKLNLTDDPKVDEGIFFNLRSVKNGIRILEGYNLTYWDTKANNRIYRIQLTSESEEGPGERYLSCCGLFVYDHLGVELSTFKAVNDASLVFDGRLCIDHNFCTNDASIRAAGTMTKYSRRYYADAYDHWRYNSRDVGSALGVRILQGFGDTGQFERPKLGTKDRRRSSISGQPLPPEFTQPRVTLARLPSGWQYLQVVAPQPMLDLCPSAVLTTGDPKYKSDTGYMRIEISQHRTVQMVTCYSANQIETDNMVSLYGLHEVLLNNMVARYQEGLIPDLYQYFRQPWAMMVFHDRFRTFLGDIRNAMLRCRCRDGKLTLEEKIVDNLCRFSEMTEQEHIKILEDFRTGGIDQMVETWMLNYLANNQYHLPMYAREGTAEALKIKKDSGLDSANISLAASRGRIT